MLTLLFSANFLQVTVPFAFKTLEIHGYGTSFNVLHTQAYNFTVHSEVILLMGEATETSRRTKFR